MKIGLTIRDYEEFQATGNVSKYAKQVFVELTQEQIQALNIAKSEYISDIFIIVEPLNTEQCHH